MTFYRTTCCIRIGFNGRANL